LNAFSSYHPEVLMLYFVTVVTLSMLSMNPIFLAIALFGAMCYFASLEGIKKFLTSICFYFPMFILIAVTNPLFSHNGETILFFLNDNPVTFEAIIYGMAIALLIIAVMYWFKCYNNVMTTDKFVYLFGRVIPKLSLILSMALRFTPLFKEQIKKISKAQKTMGLYSSKSISDKVMGGMRVFSALLTWSLENAIDTADSMRARGYGLPGRTSFSLFTFAKRDFIMLSGIIITLIAVLIDIPKGFSYYPVISAIDMRFSYFALAVLMFIPFLTEVKENLKWKYLISKI